MTKRLRIGVIGTGIIARVMHLHYLDELAESFEVASVCDIVPENAKTCAERYGVAATYTDWRELIQQPLDAVVVLTSGSHAPIAVAAAKAGLHVLVEKPMCFSVSEGQAMVAAAEEAGVTLMVAYPKRYDPAYVRFREAVSELSAPRLLRVTTFESPFLPYIEHYALSRPAPMRGDVLAVLQAETDASIRSAIGEATDFERQV